MRKKKVEFRLIIYEKYLEISWAVAMLVVILGHPSYLAQFQRNSGRFTIELFGVNNRIRF